MDKKPIWYWGSEGHKLIEMTRKLAATLFLLTCFDSLVIWVHCSSKAEIDQHLQMGMQLLAKGQYSDALSHFHSAVDADPSNYMSYYKRATVFLALNRPRSSLADLERVIQLKPDFYQARVKRGIVLLKMGRLDEAHIDLEKALHKEPSNDEASRAYGTIESLKKSLEEIRQLMDYKNYQAAVDRMDEVIEHIPWDPSMREIRAEAYLALGNTMHAISDLRTLTKLTLDNTQSFFKLSYLHYQLGETDEALGQIRECLKLDPEHKDCYPFYKTLKKVAKFLTAASEAQNSQNWNECVEQAQKALKNEPKVQQIRFHGYDKMCQCLMKSDNQDASFEARKACNEALKINEEPRLYCDRADTFLNDDMFEEAVKDYRQALDIDENFKRAKDGLAKAQKLEKLAKKRDYYKILGVPRNAGKRQITKAYRKLAQKWHPDNFQDEEDKKEAEKKFMDIAAAKEVLTDKEMRHKYDNGEDPLDPESQQGRGFNPFQNGGHPFHFTQGGGPFGSGGSRGFKFHFDF